MKRSASIVTAAGVLAAAAGWASTTPVHAGPTGWTQQIGSSADDEPRATAADPSGAVVVAGLTHGVLPGQTSPGDTDAVLIRYDKNGNQLWVRQFGTNGDDTAEGVATTSNGDIYVTGWTDSQFTGQTAAGGIDGFLARFDKAGTLKSLVQFGSPGDDRPLGIAVRPNGTAFVVGETTGTFDGQPTVQGHDLFVAKFDKKGKTTWLKQLGGPGAEYAYSVGVASNEDVYVAGTSTGDFLGHVSAGNSDAFLVKFDKKGAQKWARFMASAGLDKAVSVAVAGTGDVRVAGWTNGHLEHDSLGSNDAFVAAYDKNGSQLWLHQVGSAGADWFQGVVFAKSGRAYAVGGTTLHLDGQTQVSPQDVIVMGFDKAGVVTSVREFGAGSNTYSYGLAYRGANAQGAPLAIAMFTDAGLFGFSNAGDNDIGVITLPG